MKCMHCRVEFHDKMALHYLGADANNHWAIQKYECPACQRMNLFLANADSSGVFPDGTVALLGETYRFPIYPKGSSRPPCPSEVPAAIAEDYNEACLVLADSPKASAALSRRCLQALLHDAAGVTTSNLATAIQQVIDQGHMPTYLVEMIDAIRQIGNFAAHPMKSQHTGDILPVEPHEAEWNLDVLEALFDFFYVQPAVIAKKRAALNAKLHEAGKGPMK